MKLLTIKEAAVALNCHPNTLRQWEEKGLLTPIRIGVRRDRRYPQGVIERFLARNSDSADVVKTVLPSNYDLSRIDMTGTHYEGLQPKTLINHQDYRNLDKIIIPQFSAHTFLKRFNQNIVYIPKNDLIKYPTVAEKILAIITSAKYRSGSLATINLSKYQTVILEKLNYSIAKQQPVEFVLPAFPFKIANPLKSSRGDADLAEVGSLCKFNEINLQIKRIYKPGARFHIFHDGHLYFRHFLHEEADASRYFNSLKRFVKDMGLGQVIHLHDAIEDLKQIPRFAIIYAKSRREIKNLWQTKKSRDQKIQKIIQSAKANINLAHVPYEALYRVTSAEDWDLTVSDKKLKQHINQRAEKCAFEYMVVQHALEKANFFETIAPQAVRLTVHPKEGQIGIHLVKRKTYLLPWMGVGVLKNTGEVSVHYESELLSSTKYQPVFIKGEKYPFYYQEAAVMYQGTTEFQRLFDKVVDSLTKKDFYWAFAFSNEYLSKPVRETLVGVHARLAQKGIQDRAICRQDMLQVIAKAYQGNKHIELRGQAGEIPTGVIILRDRVIHLLWGEEPAAYEVTAPVVVKRYRELFEEYWSNHE